MVTFLDAVKETAKNSVCAILNSQQTWARYLDDALGGGNGVIRQPGELAAFQRNLCNQNPPPGPVQIPSGQCSGVEYNIIIDYEQLNGPGTAWIPVNTFWSGCNGEVGGPISGPERVPDENSYEYYWTYTRLSSGARIRRRLVDISKSSITRNFRYRYERCNGQTQPCDSIPKSPRADYNYKPNQTITYNVNNGPNINLDVDVTVGAPKLDINANLVIPIGIAYIDADLNVPVNLNFNLDVNGNLNFDFGGDQNTPGGGGGDGCPPPKPPDADPEADPPPSEDPDQTGEDDPVNPAAPIIRAAVVTVQSIDPEGDVGQIGQEDNPDILIPNAGFISFKILAGSTFAWTSDIPVKNIRNFIPCPWDRGAVEVKGTPREGVVWTITPVYSKLDTSS